MKKIIMFGVILAGLIACHRGADEPLPVIPENGMDVLFRLHLPGPGTRAGEEDPAYPTECKVESIDILAFHRNSQGKEEYEYKPILRQLSIGNNPDEILFTVKLQKSTDLYRFVILTNASDILNAFGTITPGTQKEDLLAQLFLSRTNEWETPEEINFQPFPMWGESELTPIIEGMSSLGSIKLLRMVSRIDVTVSTRQTQDNFSLKSVRLYNRKTKGHLIPGAENVNPGTGQVVLPTMPDNTGGMITILLPSKVYTTQTASDTIIKYIYTFEADVPASGKAEDATCLVIGGNYKQPLIETFYRIDFRNQEQTGYGNLLRNHFYTINIKDVSSEGYPTPEEAFNGISMNMSGEIIEWNDGGTNAISFFGPSFIAVDRKDILLGNRSGNRVRRAFTTNVETEKIELAFTDTHNDPVTEINDGIENTRFRVRFVKTAQDEITYIEVVALADYQSGNLPSNVDHLKISAYNLELLIRIEQLESDPSDWYDGGDYDYEF